MKNKTLKTLLIITNSNSTCTQGEINPVKAVQDFNNNLQNKAEKNKDQNK